MKRLWLKKETLIIFIKSLILAFATHLLLSFLPIIVYENIFGGIFYGDFNILTATLVILAVFSLITVLYLNTYGNLLKWLKYSPIYLAVSLFILAPGMPWQQYSISRLYANMSGLLLIFFYVFIVFMQLIGGVLVFALFAVIITAVRENKSDRKKSKAEKKRKKGRITLQKNGEYPLWFRVLYSFIDAVVMRIPFIGLVYNAGILISDVIPIEELGSAMLYVLILILICGVMMLAYYMLRFRLTLKIHKTYKSYLLCIPFYILVGISLCLIRHYTPVNYGQLFFWSTEPLEFLQPLISFVGGDEKFLAILYVIEWFVAISLVFAVRYIIKRIKARKEGQENNPEMPSETIHEAETRVCCEQNSTGEEVNLHNTVAEEAINAKQEHTN